MFKLSPQLNKELKHPLGKIYSTIPSNLKSSKLIATIGDISTLNVFTRLREPDLSIVDYKTKRLDSISESDLKIIKSIGTTTLNVINSPGTISKELWNAIETAFNTEGSTRIVVDGEEDLATLPVVAMAPDNTLVVYGQPNEGIVIITVNSSVRKRAKNFLNRMREN